LRAQPIRSYVPVVGAVWSRVSTDDTPQPPPLVFEMRAHKQLDEAALTVYLTPFWLAWSTRKRQDGRPYDPGNITWLTEWALNGTIPPGGGSKGAEAERPAAPSPEQTRRMLAEKEKQLKKAVPPPVDVRAKMRTLAEKMAGKDAHCVGTGSP
jgi:hypothetical protein